MWTIVTDDAAYEAAKKLARGSYQLGLLRGEENLSAGDASYLMEG